MSPLVDLDRQIDTLRGRSFIFDTIMQHLARLIQDKGAGVSLHDVAVNLGIYILRAKDDDSEGFDSESYEIQARIKTFSVVMEKYIGKLNRDEIERKISSNASIMSGQDLRGEEDGDVAGSSSSVSPLTGRNRGSSATLPPVSAPGSSVSAGAGSSPDDIPAGSIQERSVKVVFSNPLSKPSEDDLRVFMEKYGTVNNVCFCAHANCFFRVNLVVFSSTMVVLLCCPTLSIVSASSLLYS